MVENIDLLVDLIYVFISDLIVYLKESLGTPSC
jgi:hypothetical protein